MKYFLTAFLSLGFLFFVGSVWSVGRAPKGYWKCSYRGTEMECVPSNPPHGGCHYRPVPRGFTSSWQASQDDANSEALANCQNSSISQCIFDECWQKD